MFRSYATTGFIDRGYNPPVTISCNKPAGVLVGDIMVMAAVGAGASTGNNYAATPSGWTVGGTYPYYRFANPIASPHGVIFYRVVDGTEGSSFTVNWADSNYVLMVGVTICAYGNSLGATNIADDDRAEDYTTQTITATLATASNDQKQHVIYAWCGGQYTGDCTQDVVCTPDAGITVRSNAYVLEHNGLHLLYNFGMGDELIQATDPYPERDCVMTVQPSGVATVAFVRTNEAAAEELPHFVGDHWAWLG